MLTAYVNLKDDKIAEGIAACEIVRAASILEPGCEVYDFFQSPRNLKQVVFVEEWTTLADLHTHFEQAAFLEFKAKMEDLTATPTELKIFESQLVTE